MIKKQQNNYLIYTGSIMSEKRTETFRLTDLSLFADTFEELKAENPKYDLSVKDRVSAGLTDVRIYEYVYEAGEAELSVQAEASEADSSSPETSSAGTQVTVTAGGLPVGRIRKAGTAKILSLRDEGKISGMHLDIHGGRYRILHQSYSEADTEQDDFYEETGEIPVTALLTVTLKEEGLLGAALPEDSSESGSADSFITTSYDLVENETDYRKRGFAPLLLALIVSAAYLAFMIPYWLTNRQAVTALYPVIGPDVQNTGLFIHFGLFAAGVLFTAISMGTKNALMPALSSLLFAGSVFLMPSYVKYAAVPALLALIGSLRKKKGFGFIRFLLGLITLGCIGLCVWQLLGKTVPAQITSVQHSYGELTSGPAGFDPAADIYGEDEYTDDFSYDEADDEFTGDDDEFSDDGEFSDGDVYPEDGDMVIYVANSGTMTGSVSGGDDAS
jgi:hypothetical protein